MSKEVVLADFSQWGELIRMMEETKMGFGQLPVEIQDALHDFYELRIRILQGLDEEIAWQELTELSDRLAEEHRDFFYHYGEFVRFIAEKTESPETRQKAQDMRSGKAVNF